MELSPENQLSLLEELAKHYDGLGMYSAYYKTTEKIRAIKSKHENTPKHNSKRG